LKVAQIACRQKLHQ